MKKRSSPIKYIAWSIPAILFLASFLFLHQEPKKILLAESYDNCTSTSNSRYETGTCLEQLALHLNKGYKISDVETTIRSMSDSAKLQWCHEFAHYIGWEIFKDKKSLSGSFSSASGICDSGMYHGIMEEYIKEKGGGYDTENFLNVVIPHACDDIISSPDIPQGMSGTCYHGLGHAFMLISENDLNRSLQLCDHLDANVAQGCYTGSLMENIQSKQIGVNTAHPKTFAYNTNDMDYPCNVLDAKYKNHCYVYKGISNVVELKGDFGKAFSNCLKIDPSYRNICFYGVGSDIPGPHWSSATAGTKCQTALPVSKEAYKQCILGAVGFIAQLNLGNAQAMVDFCGVIETDYKNLCYETAGNDLRTWVTPSESLETKCNFFESLNAKEICKRGGTMQNTSISPIQ